jgi:hypothetical protein
MVSFFEIPQESGTVRSCLGPHQLDLQPDVHVHQQHQAIKEALDASLIMPSLAHVLQSWLHALRCGA